MAMFGKNGKIRGRKMREQRSQELWQQIGEVWHLSLPAILTQITTIAMQYIDSAMVGALGANASAAIGLVATTTWLLGGITYAIAAGFSVQVAHYIGGKKRKKPDRWYAMVCWLHFWYQEFCV